MKQLSKLEDLAEQGLRHRSFRNQDISKLNQERMRLARNVHNKLGPSPPSLVFRFSLGSMGLRVPVHAKVSEPLPSTGPEPVAVPDGVVSERGPKGRSGDGTE